MRIVLSLVFLCLSSVTGHISLIYPPARKYDFDFMDNTRTPGPCGVPKGLGPSTTLLAGSTINVNFHLAYPHKGGFFLEVMKNNTNAILRHPQSGVLSTDNTTLRSAQLTLPNQECRGCWIRLVRQAAEWGAACRRGYLFWSCADVDIIQTGFTELCSGHGEWRNNKCECERLWVGDRCEHSVDCKDASDCNEHGECVDIATSPNPIKHCYCQHGWHGTQCNKASSVITKDIDYSLYTEAQLSPHYNLYYRYIALSEEIEMVLKVNSSNWVAIGWKPNSFRSGCQLFPNLPNTRSWSAGEDEVKTKATTSKPEAEAEAEVTTITEPETEPETTTEPETEPETTTEPETEPEITSEPESEGEVTSEPETEGEVTSEPETESEVTSEPETEGEVTSEPETESELTSEPESEGEVTSEPETEGEVTSEPETESEVTSEPESVGGVTSEPESEGGVTSEPESEGEVTSEPETEGEVTSEPETESEVTSEPESEGGVTSEPESEGGVTSEPESEGEVTSEPETEGEVTSEPETESEVTSEPESEGGVTSEPESEGGVTSEPESEGEATSEPESGSGSPTCPSPLPELGYSDGGRIVGNNDRHGNALSSGMDCSDIIVGTARGETSRIGDYYTRDRSTPKHDSIYGGEDSLTAALGFEKDGQTVIVFRRKVQATHRSDHTIERDTMSVIWAHGQIEDNYRHAPATGDKPGFYAKDQLLYHGARPNRGTTSINFLDSTRDLSTTCNGNWPTECNNCGLEVSWVYNEDTDVISFTMKARLNGKSKWIGVGFSKDKNMADSDAIIGWVDNGQVQVSDRWMTGRIQPQKDAKDDIKNKRGTVEDGVTTITFDRARDTGDSSDLAFTDTQCLYMFYAVGGSYNSDGSIRKHVNTPTVSSNKVCIRSCDVVATGVRLISTVEVNLDKEFVAKLNDKDSDEFKKLERTMIEWMDMGFRFLSGYQETRVLQFKPGSTIVVADVESIRESDSVSSKAEYKTDIELLLQRGQSSPPQGYTINGFTVSEPRSVQTPKPFRLTLIEEIVIGLAVSLVIVIVIATVCKLSESRREKAKSLASDKRQMFNEDSSSSTTSLSNQKQNLDYTMPKQGYSNPEYNTTLNSSKDTQRSTITYDEFMKAKHVP